MNYKVIDFVEKNFPNYRISGFGRSYVYRIFYRVLVTDLLWAGVSAAIVYIYVIFHTKSLFVGTFSMSMILFAFPNTLVLYRLVCNITNLSSLHLMVVFVVLGIGADNIFVLWDAWQQSKNFP